MVIAHYTDPREPPTQLSEQIEVSEEALSATIPSDTSALLPDGRALVSQRGQSAISSFLDKNAGLLLVASSQFFFSASNLCVKLLNSLDESERVPVLEVRDILGGVMDTLKLTTSNVKLIWVRMASTSTFSSYSTS